MKTDVKQKKQTLQQLIDNLQQNGGGTDQNYITIGGIRLYVSNTEPTGDIPNGSVGVGW